MNTSNGGTESHGAQRQRGWWRRNWLWFVPAMLAAVVVLGGAVAYWALYQRVFQLDVYQSAMRTIQNDEGLRRQLGEPIKTIAWPPPSAEVNVEERILWWEIAGPKGHAKAHLRATPMAGKWEIRLLQVDGKRIAQADDGSGEAPRFEAPKSPAAKQESSTPAPQINLPLPPDMGPEK